MALTSGTFPELAGIRTAIGGRRMVLDGEIVAVGSDGRPSFTRLQRRWPQQRRLSAELVREVPTRFMAFDVLAVDGVDVTGEPYGRRREIHGGVMVVDTSPTMTVPRHWVDVSPADMLEVCAATDMEGRQTSGLVVSAWPIPFVGEVDGQGDSGVGDRRAYRHARGGR